MKNLFIIFIVSILILSAMLVFNIFKFVTVLNLVPFF